MGLAFQEFTVDLGLGAFRVWRIGFAAEPQTLYPKLLKPKPRKTQRENTDAPQPQGCDVQGFRDPKP